MLENFTLYRHVFIVNRGPRMEKVLIVYSSVDKLHLRH